jgi:hypothetical protein
MLKVKLNKSIVLDSVKSLVKANRDILKNNKIEGVADDYIHINIKMAASIDIKETVPIQIKVPFAIYSSQDGLHSTTLLIVKEKPEVFQELVQELNISAITKVVTIAQIK